MTKQTMWEEIVKKSKQDPIIAKAMQGYADETLEDQTQVLMAIVLEQSAVIDAVMKQNSRFQSDFYARKAQ